MILIFAAFGMCCFAGLLIVGGLAWLAHRQSQQEDYFESFEAMEEGE